MSVYDSMTKLRNAARTLQLHWAQTQEQWRDPASRAFESEHLAPLEPRVSTALRAMNNLSAILDRVRAECSDDH